MWFYNFGKWGYRHKWAVVIAWIVAVGIALPFVPRVLEPLKTGGVAAAGLESSVAADTLQQKLGFSTSSLVVFYQSKDPNLKALDPKFIIEVQASLQGLDKSPIKTSVTLHTTNPRQISQD